LGLGINNGDMMRDAAKSGLGIALLPTFIAGPAIRDGSLIEVDIGYKPEAEFIYMAHSEGRNPSAKLRAIADHLRRAFGSPPYWEPDAGASGDRNWNAVKANGYRCGCFDLETDQSPQA
jgi:LysR substrate binding domain